MSAETNQWTPEPDAVAALIPQRTGDPSGRAATTFTGATVPTASQVVEVIDAVVAEVHGACGVIDPDLYDTAKRVVALGAASYVELQFFPDKQLSPQSPSQELWSRYQTALKALKASNTGDPGGNESPGPEYSFPSNSDVPAPWPPITTITERF